MGGLLGFSRAVDRINTVIGRGVSWLILVAILVSAANAIVRKVWSVSSNAWLELQWYLYGAAFLLAAAYTLLENEHIRIDIVYGGRKRRTQHWIDLLGHLLFLMPFVILMIWLASSSPRRNRSALGSRAPLTRRAAERRAHCALTLTR